MGRFPVGNAPCSWGTLEFEGLGGEQVPWKRMMDELAETGYTGMELGDWGYLPAEAGVLSLELARRGLTMLGAFVPVAFRHEGKHAAGQETALRTARLLAAVAGHPAPFLVLADENGSDPVRTGNAGRIKPEMGLGPEEWKVFARGVESIAAAVKRETGLRTVFHHHCAGYVETPQEIQRLLSLTSPELVGLVFDTGHFVYGSGGHPALEGPGDVRGPGVVHALQGLPPGSGPPGAGRGLGLLPGGAPRRVLRAGQRQRGFPLGGPLAGPPRLRALRAGGAGRAAGHGGPQGKRPAQPGLPADPGPV